MKRFHPARQDDDDADEESRSPVNEHTRLLPNRLDSDVIYLSPDDPAVSPYNLWTVRLVRYLTVLLTAITVVWWTLMLVSAFVTPPGLHLRGSTWFAFSYACVAVWTLVVTLLFFTAPSRAARVLSVIMAVLLGLDTIVLLAVEKTRREELWVGIASVVWALLVSLWALLADRTVAWGKHEEEERLTGRIETRRTVFEWLQVLGSSFALGLMTLVVVLMTFSLILRAVDAKLAPPGELYWVDGDKYQVHLYCSGNKTDAAGRTVPTVLIEGGEVPVENGLWQLAQNAVNNGSISRFCFADRPGMAWVSLFLLFGKTSPTLYCNANGYLQSDAAPSPLSAGIATDAFSEALVRAGEHGPWVLASAGIGSLYSRVFSARHGRAIQAMLLIDPLHEDLLSRVASPGRGFMLWLQGVLSPLGLVRLPGALFRGRNSADRVWGRSSGSGGKALFAKLQESLVADSLTKREVESSRAIQRAETAVAVISSGEQIRRDSEWEGKQRDLTHLTQNLVNWDVVDDAPHQIWSTWEGREMIERRLRNLVRLSEKEIPTS